MRAQISHDDDALSVFNGTACNTVFSMASSFVEDILGTEVDEKAVSAFVGSLESQLASPSSSGTNSSNSRPHLQRSNQVVSSSSACISSQSNKSSVASVISISAGAPGLPTITGKTLFNNNTSANLSTPINIAPRPNVSSTVSLAPKPSLTLLSPQSGNRGYLPVQTPGLGVPLMMGPMRGPLAPRLVSTAMLQRTNTPQNTVHKLPPTLQSQTSSVQRTPVKPEPNMQLQPTQMLNNIRMHAPSIAKPMQSHSMVVKSEPNVAANHVPHGVKSESSNNIVQQPHNNITIAQNRSATQAQVNRVKEQVMKLQSFFTRLITLATDQSPEIGHSVQELIKAVMVCFNG